MKAHIRNTIILAIVLGLPQVLYAGIYVDSVEQEVPSITNGNCTLGEAIQTANTGVVVDGCGKSPTKIINVDPQGGSDIYGGKTITINLPANSVIVLKKGYNSMNAFPTITSNIKITGNGIKLYRDPSAPPFRMFEVAKGASLEVNRVFFENGYLKAGNMYGSLFNGGAISSAGILRINHSTFKANKVDGMGYGGAIYNASPNFAISNSTLYWNSAYLGGAIYESSSAEAHSVTADSAAFMMVNTHVVYNAASDHGGGIMIAGGGGGITFNDNGTLYAKGVLSKIINSTFVGNSGGGIFQDSDGVLLLGNDIITDNGSVNVQPAGLTLSLGSNIIGSANAVDVFSTWANAGGTDDQFGKTSANVGIALGQLTETLIPGQTVIPFGDGLAINKGNQKLCDQNLMMPPSALNASGYIDQLGQVRDATCDIGALEAVCGDGIVQTSLGEQCDLGKQNGVAGSKCSATCKPQ